MNNRASRSGHSLTEMMVALTILAMVIAGTMSGWLFVVYGERQNSIQDKLDLDVRMALENIRRDLRLTSMTKMFFYPSGPGPYTAISFPMAIDNDGDGLVELDANTNIIWDVTKIYHVYASTPNEFRVTTITNRDNTLTDAQRQAQINSVAVNGNASATYEAANASTRAIFKNLFTWSVTPDGAVFDGYASSVSRAEAVSLGSILLSAGNHSFQFRIIGKNPSASGYKIGLDALNVSPSGAQREMERQTVSAYSGATPAPEYQAGGSWSENYDLAFAASATGQYVTLTMENDRWEDSNFGGTGADNVKCIMEFDTTLSPKDNVVRLEGNGTTWGPDALQPVGFAGNYPVFKDSSDTLRGAAVRVLLRGGQMTNGAWLAMDGRLYGFWVDAGAVGSLHVQDLRIHRAGDHVNPTSSVASAGMALQMSGAYSYDIPANGFVFATPPGTNAFYIEKEKSYIVSYYVNSGLTKGNARYYWVTNNDAFNPVFCTYMITNGANVSDLQELSWNAKPDQTLSTNLYGVAYSMTVLYTSNGTYQSAIFDTHQSSPTYQDISWNADLGYYASIRFKVRSGSNSDMSDASPWTNVSWLAGSGSISPGSGRYFQYLAQLISSSSGWETPKLKNVTVRFAGEQKIVDIGGSLTRGPNYGIFEMLVDGTKVQRGVTIAMQVYEDMPVSGGGTKRLTSISTVEIEPRNTGK
jgi:prepilin-type N-terminal cleavage/methylation domain-containing protein